MLTFFIYVSKFLQLKKINTEYTFSAYCIFCNVKVKKNKIQIIANITGDTVAYTTGLYQLKCYSLGFNLGYYYYDLENLGIFGQLALF